MLTFEDMDATLRGGGVKAVSAPQLFPTPPWLAARMVEGIREGQTVLEPSAGTGAILRALPPGVVVTAVEINHELAAQLAQGDCGRDVRRADFLECHKNSDRTEGYCLSLGAFDWVVANPPFTRNQDVQHIRHMWQFVKPGGWLVTLSSVSWTFGACRVCREFREWLDELGAEREDIPRGTFAGTDVASVLLRIHKED